MEKIKQCDKWIFTQKLDGKSNKLIGIVKENKEEIVALKETEVLALCKGEFSEDTNVLPTKQQ